MPEGAEVKVIADALQSTIKNKILISIEVISGRYDKHPETFPDFSNKFPAQILDIYSIGKFICFNLESYYLVSTLGMSARWTSEVGLKHNRLKLTFSDRSNIFFNDIRNFGTLQLHSPTSFLNKINNFGPDPLNDNFDLNQFKINLSKYKTKYISDILLNPKAISSVGNYVRAEALYMSKVSPFRKIRDLTIEEVEDLAKNIQSVLITAYKAGGASFSTFQDANGNKGNYSYNFQVYGKETDPLGNIVQKDITEAKRAIWWVPAVQI